MFERTDEGIGPAAAFGVWAAASITTLRVGEAGTLSAVVWPGGTQDYELDAMANKVRGSTAPCA